MIQFRLLHPGDTFLWATPRLPTVWAISENGDMPLPMPEPWDGRLDVSENWRREMKRLIAADSAMGAFRGTTCLAIAAATPRQQLHWWSLSECVVDTPFRRNGIGTQLLQHLETYLVETMGAQVMVAYARYGDSAAQAFLTRNAYLIAGTEADHHEMVDAWIYRKTLCDHRLAALSKSPA